MVDRSRPGKGARKAAAPVKGIIEKWAYELLKGYNQDQAAKNLVDINPKLFKELPVAPGEWGYYSLDVGTYPPDKLAKIKSGLPLPPGARGIVIDAGYSVQDDHHRRNRSASVMSISILPTRRHWITGSTVNWLKSEFSRTSAKRSSEFAPTCRAI